MFHVAVAVAEQAIFNGLCMHLFTTNGPYRPIEKTHERLRVQSSYSTLKDLPESFLYLDSSSPDERPVYLTPELVPVVAQNAKIS